MQDLYDDNGEVIHLQWKTPYNHNTRLESVRTGLKCTDPSKAQQHQEEEANINTIVSRFLKTGLLPQVQLPPSLDEFGEIFDFQSAMEVMNEAKRSFMAMSPEIRNAFHNSPAHFVAQIDAMLGDQDADRKAKNLEVLRAMGLAVQAGPIADQTTLGDVLKAIKERTASEVQAPPSPANGPPGA